MVCRRTVQESLSRAADATCTAAPRPERRARVGRARAVERRSPDGRCCRTARTARPARRRRRSTPPWRPVRGRPGSSSGRRRAAVSNVLPIDVGDQVAEAIDAQHFAVDAVRRRRRGCGRSSRCIAPAGAPERRQLDALREPRRGRREPIAAFERPADGRPRVLPLGQLDDALRRHARRAPASARRCRAPRTGSRRPRGDAAPRRSDARIDDDEEDGAGGKVAIRGRQLERAGQHVVRRHVVRDVDERRVRADRRARRPSSCRRSDRAMPKSVSSAMTGRAMRISNCRMQDAESTTAKLVQPQCSRYAGFRKRISRRLFCSRNESETRSPANRRMMSRLSRIAWRPRAAG